jgi:hypothetical protein
MDGATALIDRHTEVRWKRTLERDHVMEKNDDFTYASKMTENLLSKSSSAASESRAGSEN